MKIVFIGGRDIRKLGGIENYMLNLATCLKQAGHTPIVCCESDKDKVETINGFEVRHFKGLKSNLLCKPWVGLKATLYAVFKEKNVDMIHYNAWPPSLWCWIPTLKGIHSLMEGHGLEWQRSKYSGTASRVLKFMEFITAHLNRNLIMCSESQVRYFKKEYGVDSVCIPTATNLPSEEEDSDILTRFGITKKKYFLYLGRLVQDKNPDYLIKAFKRISNCGFQLVLAGENNQMPEYVQRLHSLASECNDIIFTGAAYNNDKNTLLRNAFCFCIPSTIEGLSISLLEAMSYKLPIIASDIEGNKEVLEDDSALWVKPMCESDLVSAMNHAISTSDFLKSAVEKNYKKVNSSYTWNKVTEKYIDCLNNIINASK